MATARITGPGNKENVDLTIPDENQLFNVDMGEGAQQTYGVKGGKLTGYDYQSTGVIPKDAAGNLDWQGKTIGQYRGMAQQQVLGGIGASNLKTISPDAFNALKKQYGEAQNLNANDFISQFKGSGAFGGESVARSVNPNADAAVTAGMTPGQQSLAAAQASGPAPQDQGQALGAIQQFAPSPPAFYKPTTPVPGYDPQTVFDAQGKPLSYDQFIAAGGKPDFSNVQSGSPPQGGQVAGGVTTAGTAGPSISPVVDMQLQEDPGYQQLLKDRADFNNVVNQNKSLTETYAQLTKEMGIPAMNTELMNMKNIIDGTEDDIRTEVTKAGGFATESQVLALTNARNKQLIKNYNNLLTTKQMAMETVNNMINLAGQDRQFAMQSIQQKLQIDQQIIEYQQKMQDNAKQTYNNIVSQVGYAGLQQMTNNDPYYTSLIEKTLGLGKGGLAQLASYVKPLSQAEQADLEYKQTQTATAKAQLAQMPEEFALKKKQVESGLAVDKAQIANIKSEIANRGSSGLSSQIVETPNGKIMVTYDKQGTIVKQQPVGQVQGGAMDMQQLAKQKSNVEQISELTKDKGLNAVVGPNALARGRIGLPFGLSIPLSARRLSGTGQNFVAGVEQLRSNLNLDALIKAKASGATFGQLSDQELQVLASAATKMGTWATKDKQGNVTGYNVNEKNFRAELDKINNFAKLDYVLKGGNPQDVGVQMMSDGTMWMENSDGSKTKF